MPTTQDDSRTASAPEPGKRWSFDEGVTAAFDDMLERSIPNIADMRKIVTDATCWQLDRSGPRVVVDLGVSRGAALAPIIDRMGVHARYYGYDVSAPMLAAAQERFQNWIDSRYVRIAEHDLRRGFPESCVSLSGQPRVVLSILTLQFVPIEYRQMLLREIFQNLHEDGCLILVEKVLGEADETNRLMVDLYHGMKREKGYEQEAIDRKAMSLEGVLVPLPASVNEQFLRGAGFDLVEVIWAWCNFRAWVAVKR